jgi:GNAT superfamily N-acetyltransferase
VIRPCGLEDFEQIWDVINDGAQAYRGIIPADRCPDPYMSREQLQHEIGAHVVFWGYEVRGVLLGVMGLQDVLDVTLIRHAYVRASAQRQGIGAKLLSHLGELTGKPVLLGTWADAFWAVRFYQQHGFDAVDPVQKDFLLRKYWSVPERQIETSVVLADQRWRDLRSSAA